MKDKQKQLIDIAEIIRQGVFLGFLAGTRFSSESILKMHEWTNDKSREEMQKAIEEVQEKLCSRWIPKTDIMRGDIVK